MTTAAQVKRLVKPLLARHDDLVRVGRWIFLKPVRHVARAILIDRTGSANVFQPTWAVTPLVDPSDVFSLNWGERMYHGGLWRWDDPLIADDLIRVVENVALPLLRPIETLDHFVTFASSRERFPLGSFDLYLMKRVSVDAARGELESARWCCEQLLSGRTRDSMPLLRERFKFITETICPLVLKNDREGLIALLHEWEAYSVKHLGLEGIWEKTPFPLEEQMT